MYPGPLRSVMAAAVGVPQFCNKVMLVGWEVRFELDLLVGVAFDVWDAERSQALNSTTAAIAIANRKGNLLGHALLLGNCVLRDFGVILAQPF